jgi:hypothetical protein
LLWEGRVDAWENIPYLQERYGIENRFVFVDCGYKPEEVARECLRAAKPGDTNQWNMLRGEEARDGYMKIVGEKRFRRLFSDYTRAQSSSGMTYKFIRFSNLLAKDKLAALMAGGTFGVPVDASKAYHGQMQSEMKREVSPGHWRWVPVKEGKANHLWDCEDMQVVAACIYKVLVSMDEVK